MVNLPDIALEIGVATDTVYVNEAPTLAAGQIATEGYVGVFGQQLSQDTPFNVRSYTSKLLQNQLAFTLSDVLEHDASVTSSFSSKASPEANQFLIHGFPVSQTASTAINGLFGLYGDISNMNFVERVDTPSRKCFDFEGVLTRDRKADLPPEDSAIETGVHS